MTNLTHLLSDGWTVRPAEPVPQLPLLATVPATVPCCVHTDLLAGLIPDPYLDDNARVLSWIDDTDCGQGDRESGHRRAR